MVLGMTKQDDVADFVQPFLLDVPNVNGCLVRLNTAIDEILGRHAYPLPVQQLLAECLTLAAGLANAQKTQGILTLQLKGDGPIAFMVADVTHAGNMRGFAQIKDPKALQAMGHSDNQSSHGPGALSALLGTGYMVVTLDQGPDMARVQSIVSITGETLHACMQHYFEKSEQIQAELQLACARDEYGAWRGGAMIIKQLPDSINHTQNGQPQHDQTQNGQPHQNQWPTNQKADWERVSLLMATLEHSELFDPTLPAHDLLYRLFHQEKVRVFPPTALRFQCRCSPEKIEMVLRTLTATEILEALKDNQFEAICEFCNQSYLFSRDKLIEMGLIPPLQ